MQLKNHSFRPQSRRPVQIRGHIIGGPRSLVCLPLAGKEQKKLLEEASFARKNHADLVEWRLDAFDEVEDLSSSLACLQDLRRQLADIPLILTCRAQKEGGARPVAEETRLAHYLQAIDSGAVDIVDIEQNSSPVFREQVLDKARSTGVKVLFSSHNFTDTPNEDILCQRLCEAQRRGADIAKIAVTPNDIGDVLRLMDATYRARIELVEIPLVCISMGPMGRISRLAGGLFGSDITFACGLQSTAPGQIPLAQLHAAMAILHGKPLD